MWDRTQKEEEMISKSDTKLTIMLCGGGGLGWMKQYALMLRWCCSFGNWGKVNQIPVEASYDT